MKTMKRLIAIAAAMLFTTAASAADLGDTVADYLRPASNGTVLSGFYGGVTGGLEFQNIAGEHNFGTDEEPFPVSINGIGADGFSGGLTTGFDIAAGKWRFGPWLDVGTSNVKTEIMGVTALEQDYYGAAGLRAGFVHGSSLIYARAGYQLSAWSSGDENVDIQQWLAGVGIESAINNKLSWRVSADYLLLDQASVGGEDISADVNNTDGLRAQIGLVFRP